MNETTDRFFNLLDPLIDKFLDLLPISWADNLAYLHPYIAIFAVSVPLIAIVFQASKKAELVKSGNILYLWGIGAIFLAFISGKSAYIDVVNNISADGLELLNTHANFGMFILLSYFLILLLVLIQLATKKVDLQKFITFLVFLGGAFIFYMMLTGIKLVFHYGAGFIL
jgi:hypothetical protein